MNYDPSFISGIASGITQTFLGHPLDTIKVKLQNNEKINLKSIKIFNGITPVLLTNSLLTGIQFYSYKNYSPFMVGFISALLTTPIEYYKIQKQMHGKYPKTIPTGFGITFARELVGLNSYFILQEYLEKSYGVFISGGIAGSTSWLLTYQIDTIKSRIQTGDTFIKAYNKGNFNKGLTFCLARAFLVNSFGFLAANHVSLKN
jgi:uncharacterized protein with PQ loop repeat